MQDDNRTMLCAGRIQEALPARLKRLWGQLTPFTLSASVPLRLMAAYHDIAIVHAKKQLEWSAD